MSAKLKKWTLHGLGWLAAMMFGLIGVTTLIDSPLNALAWLALAAVCVPLVALPGIVRGIGIFAAFLFVGMTIEGADAARAEREAAAEAEELQVRFEEERPEILSRVTTALDTGDWRTALQLASVYEEVEDPELDELVGAAQERQRAATEAEKEADRQRAIEEIEERLRSVPASEAVLNRNLYRRLTQLDPGNQAYEERLAHYDARAEQIEEAEREERLREQRARQKRIAEWGPPPEPSAWDGSYRPVKDYLRDIAHDPGSIDFDGCTRVYHATGEGWLVGCDYRGKNAFGALVKNSHWFIIRHDRVIKQAPPSAYSAG